MLSSCGIAGGHLPVDGVMDKLGPSLEDEIGLIEIDLMGDLEFVDERDTLMEVGGFVEVDVDKGGEFGELLKTEFVAAVFNGDFFLSFCEFEIAVPFDEGDVVEMSRLPEMPLLEEF